MFGIAYKTSEYIFSSLSYLVFKKSMDDTTKSIYSNIREILNYNPEFINIIEENDIENKLKIFKIFLSEFSNSDKSETIFRTVESIYQVILVINTLLSRIKVVLKKHSLKIFSKYRKPNYGDKLEKLKLYCKVLDNRFDFLCKIDKVIHYNNGLDFDNRLIKFNSDETIKNEDLTYTIIEINKNKDNNNEEDINKNDNTKNEIIKSTNEVIEKENEIIENRNEEYSSDEVYNTEYSEESDNDI